ncbi:FixH family protein [Pontibacter actiniarum]|uniref:Nitrogen fixation protein FixH n=1 Tax=Pontibacter actiniarum TaxID=323450 RepID=A0A1X9YQ47_9BACT|nr:FixH family protein [Pontibacter actiniarum]ARS34987.1 nitrogen fixation protein FixH [Pontibacter actiniarum]
MTTEHKTTTLWPYGIIAAIVLFAGYIIFFVTKAMRQDVDLVSKNYYEQEIAYQDHINTVGRTVAVGEVAITYKAEDQHILLQLPEGFQGQAVRGAVSFFRPSDEGLDFEVPLQLGRDQSQLLETDTLQQGLWKVRVNFSAGNEVYFAEKAISIK